MISSSQAKEEVNKIHRIKREIKVKIYLLILLELLLDFFIYPHLFDRLFIKEKPIDLKNYAREPFH